MQIELHGSGSSAVIESFFLDRWLCVPAFQQVCPFHFT